MYANKLDGIQNNMVPRLLQVQPDPGEDADKYFARRRQISAQTSAQQGRWSTGWAQSCVSWEKHVVRGNDAGSWAKPIYEFHSETWLREQRFLHARGARTGLRAGPGRPATRHQEGAATAKAFLK